MMIMVVKFIAHVMLLFTVFSAIDCFRAYGTPAFDKVFRRTAIFFTVAIAAGTFVGGLGGVDRYAGTVPSALSAVMILIIFIPIILLLPEQ